MKLKRKTFGSAILCSDRKNEIKNDKKRFPSPYEWLPPGRHQRRSGSRHTCPYRPLPCHSPLRWPMPDIHSHRFRIRYTWYCQRLLPTRSLHRYIGEKTKKGFRYYRSKFLGFFKEYKEKSAGKQYKEPGNNLKMRTVPNPWKTQNKKNYFLRPSTSLIPYTPGFFPTTHRVARSAPLAKTERSYARCESSIVSKFLENMTL